MTVKPTDRIRTEHRDLLPHIYELDRAAVAMEEWDLATASARLHEILEFLEDHLLPHARAEEEFLYPAVSEVVGAPTATSTMSIDHDEIAARTARLREWTASALEVWPDPKQVAEISRQLSTLHSIILLHFKKENQVLLPILDAALTAEEAEALITEMHAGHADHA